jgi:hypothetical protein
MVARQCCIVGVTLLCIFWGTFPLREELLFLFLGSISLAPHPLHHLFSQSHML